MKTLFVALSLIPTLVFADGKLNQEVASILPYLEASNLDCKLSHELLSFGLRITVSNKAGSMTALWDFQNVTRDNFHSFNVSYDTYSSKTGKLHLFSSKNGLVKMVMQPSDSRNIVCKTGVK